MRLSASRTCRLAALLASFWPGPVEARRLESGDFLKLRSAVAVALSPDGTRIAYAVENHDGPGRPYAQLWVITAADGHAVRVGSEQDRGSDPVWSPDGRAIAFQATLAGKQGLAVAEADGSGVRFLAEVVGTNSPLTFEGQALAWSPDSRRIAFVSATPGPETELASGDPVVITRYKYKPDLAEGHSRLSDNRRRHIFVVDAGGGEARALSSGSFEEHSIDWSPDGQEIAFISNREPDPDLFYNPDVFTLRVADGSVRRLTATESAEYQPRWSPDGRRLAYMGTRRGLTDLETTMEDTHVWLIDRDGGNRRELGRSVDNRQMSPCWSSDGRALFASVQERGHVRLYRLPADGGQPEAVVADPGRVTAWSVTRNDVLAYAHSGPADLPQVHLKAASGAARRLTDLNREALAGAELAEVEPFTFVSNDSSSRSRPISRSRSASGRIRDTRSS
jgi:Tol biopolymer transport system component